MINIQDEAVKIHHQYGKSEMANYKLQLLAEQYAKEYHESEVKKLRLQNVSNRRELFDKFYEWLDGLSQTEYDDMSLTDKCEKFFFKT